MTHKHLSSVDEALEAIRKGGMVVVLDDKDRENEGDLIMASDMVTPESIAFIVRHTTGILCISLEEKRLQELELKQMVEDNTDPKRTAFTVSVDAKKGVSTGVSASDRCLTIQALVNSDTKPFDLSRPGHIFPLRYREGGVLKRAGHTEAALDLARLAGQFPSGILGEIVSEDGSMAREEELIVFAKEHNLPIISIADIIRYRRRHETLVEEVSRARLPTEYGDFTARVFKSTLDGIEHMALVKGDIDSEKEVLVRVHSECLTGDILGSKRCDCGPQLKYAMQKIEEEKSGVIIYLRGHEGRGIGLGHKMRAYELQDQGRDTVEANIELGFPVDSREYGIGAQMLAHLGVKKLRLMTNNPAKYGGIEGYDLTITERVPILSGLNQENRRYLLTKKNKLGHLLDVTEKKIEETKTEDTAHAKH